MPDRRDGLFNGNFLPSARSSAHAITRGDGPEPLFGFMARRGSSFFFPFEDPPEDEITFSAALTIFDVDL